MPTGTRRRKRGGGASTVRITKGRVLVRVGGFKGTQKIAPAILIRRIPKKYITRAANTVLRKSGKKRGGVSKRRRRRKGGRKGRRRRVGGGRRKLRRSRRKRRRRRII